jgi:hypothetical protein
MRKAAIAFLTACVAAAADPSPAAALGPLAQPGHAKPLATHTGYLGHDDFRTPYRDQLFALRSRETGACGFGRLWYPFPGTRRYGFFESPGPCRYRTYRRRHR